MSPTRKDSCPASAGSLQVVHRIRDRAVDAHLEVEVVAEATAGAADVPDDLALGDRLAHRDADARLVRVARRHRARVLDAGEVAVAARRAGTLDEDDLARGRGA